MADEHRCGGCDSNTTCPFPSNELPEHPCHWFRACTHVHALTSDAKVWRCSGCGQRFTTDGLAAARTEASRG